MRMSWFARKLGEFSETRLKAYAKELVVIEQKILELEIECRRLKGDQAIRQKIAIYRGLYDRTEQKMRDITEFRNRNNASGHTVSLFNILVLW